MHVGSRCGDQFPRPARLAGRLRGNWMHAIGWDASRSGYGRIIAAIMGIVRDVSAEYVTVHCRDWRCACEAVD